MSLPTLSQNEPCCANRVPSCSRGVAQPPCEGRVSHTLIWNPKFKDEGTATLHWRGSVLLHGNPALWRVGP